MLLAPPAIAVKGQGKGLGSGLLKDAMLRTLQAAEIAGIRAFAVRAKDDEARAFYEHFDFVSSPGDPCHLFRLLKGIRDSLAQSPKRNSGLCCETERYAAEERKTPRLSLVSPGFPKTNTNTRPRSSRSPGKPGKPTGRKRRNSP
jgi:hypothetical protein